MHTLKSSAVPEIPIKPSLALKTAQKRRLNMVFLLLVLAACVIYWIVKIAQNIGQPQLEYSEGFMAYNAQLFGSGTWQWGFGAEPPYNVSFYPPVFYIIIGQLYSWFGVSLIIGRIFVLSTVVLSLFLCYLIVYQVTGRRLFSIIGGLLPLTQIIVSGWSFFMKVDLPAVMFELAGIYVAIKYWRSKGLYLSIPLFVLAFYTKQSVALGAVAVFIFLLLQSDKRRAFKWGAVCAGTVLVILGAATLATNGEFFRQIVLYQKTIPAFRPFNEIFSFWTVIYLPLLPVILLGALYVFRQPKHIISLFAALALVANSLAVARPGAGQNYLFEIIFATCLAAGAILPAIFRMGRIIDFLPFAISAALLTCSSSLVSYPDAGYAARCEEVKAIIQDAERPILTENVGVVLDAGKEPYFDPFVFYQLVRLGYWDQNITIQDLESGRIEYVITVTPIPETIQRLDPSLQEVIAEHYELVYDQGSHGNYGLVVYGVR